MSEPRDPMAELPFPINHFGLLVPDIDAGVERFGRLLGLEFRPPHVAAFARMESPGGTEEPARLQMTYATQGPPYVELLQADGDGVWAAARGFGVHHVGAYVPDLDAARSRLEAEGVRAEADIYGDSGARIITYFEPSDLTGVRLELLSDALYPGWSRWVSGGPPPGHGRDPSTPAT